MNGTCPYSAHGRLLCRVLDQIEVLFPGDAGRPTRLAVAALTAAIERDPEGAEVGFAWDQVVNELDGLDGGCVAGPLPALLFHDMVRGPQLPSGPPDACRAHAVDQAGQLLPNHDGWEDAVDALIAQVEARDPDPLEMCVAVGTVAYALSYMIVTGAGGALAELLGVWLDHYACLEPVVCGCQARE